MKKRILASITSYLLFITASKLPADTLIVYHTEQNGIAYLESIAAVLESAYEHGSEEWNKRNEEWLNSDSNEPYPDDLKNVDGDAYNESFNAAEDAQE